MEKSYEEILKILINYNMRCIETLTVLAESLFPESINYNMRCIETQPVE